jgi:membrane protease YdiL (CAAX protease family)
MNRRGTFYLLLFLAALGFAWTFACPHGNFWVKITTTVCVLCVGSFYAAGFPIKRVQHPVREATIGVVAAVVLYGIFWLGDFVAASLFGFAPKQVEAIYAIKQLGHPWLVAAVLLLVTSPGEELFWRGYVLREAVKRWGELRGFLVGAGVYGAVHIPSCNLMLVMAALVAGIFWCALYQWRKGDLIACIVSHALWTVSVFLVFPIR